MGSCRFGGFSVSLRVIFIMDKITIRNLRVPAVIGTLPHERLTPQKLLFNLELYLDLAPAGDSDSLDDTVNYQEIARRIKELAAAGKFLLLEKLAAETAALCLQYQPVTRVIVTIDKPAALADAESTAVTIERYRKK
jgi:FolB domain-containing protein